MAFRCEELCDSLWSNVRKIDQHHHRAGQQENEAENGFLRWEMKMFRYLYLALQSNTTNNVMKDMKKKIIPSTQIILIFFSGSK